MISGKDESLLALFARTRSFGIFDLCFVTSKIYRCRFVSCLQEPFVRLVDEVESLRARIFHFINFDQLNAGHVDSAWQGMIGGA